MEHDRRKKNKKQVFRGASELICHIIRTDGWADGRKEKSSIEGCFAPRDRHYLRDTQYLAVRGPIRSILTRRSPAWNAYTANKLLSISIILFDCQI